jgi:copper resistance protein C
MQRFVKRMFALVLTSMLAASAATAHAFLDHAVPSVGGTVSGSPSAIRLYFTQGIVTAFSHVHIVSDAGAVVPTGRLVNDPSDQSIVIVRLGRALARGTYSVSWQVVSVDTHTTQGTFTFTVA